MLKLSLGCAPSACYFGQMYLFPPGRSPPQHGICMRHMKNIRNSFQIESSQKQSQHAQATAHGLSKPVQSRNKGRSFKETSNNLGTHQRSPLAFGQPLMITLIRGFHIRIQGTLCQANGLMSQRLTTTSKSFQAQKMPMVNRLKRLKKYWFFSTERISVCSISEEMFFIIAGGKTTHASSRRVDLPLGKGSKRTEEL